MLCPINRLPGPISRLRGYSFNIHLVAQRDCVYLSFTDALFLEPMEEPAFALESLSRQIQQFYHRD